MHQMKLLQRRKYRSNQFEVPADAKATATTASQHRLHPDTAALLPSHIV